MLNRRVGRAKAKPTFFFLVPKLRLGMHSSTLRVEQSINTDELENRLGLPLRKVSERE
jgi:hypothetical protein